MSQICLVGAGAISRVHAAALSGHRIVSIVDPDTVAARRLAADTGAAAVYSSVLEAISAGGFERAHVLVPPPLHAEVAIPLLEAGKAVLLEKPLATSKAECNALLAAATHSRALLGVNQNFIYHPAFVRLCSLVDSRALGRPKFVSCVYNLPLRQIAARQFSHWMFAAPVNMLLEQAVHPLSQLLRLTGSPLEIRVLAGPANEIAPGVNIVQSATIALRGASLPAELRFAIGQSFPFWQVSAICDDGVIVADILANRVVCHARTRWLEAVDGLVSGLSTAGALARDSVGNALAYAASTVKLRGRSDPFFLSMQASIAAFHAAADTGHQPAIDGRFGADLVALCQTILDQGFPVRNGQTALNIVSVQTKAAAADAHDHNVLILGGTGFIGTHLVQQCLESGLSVTVLARSTNNLPPVFHDSRVRILRGDIRNPDTIRAAIGPGQIVINLAHGGGGDSFAEVRAAMVDGTQTVARACLKARARRLVHIGSIAALYLGPQAEVITGTTPPDPHDHARGDYARAKAMTDRMLLELHIQEALPLVILSVCPESP
jgi:predicted dehydrogenase/putative NADH-flavin reductase